MPSSDVAAGEFTAFDYSIGGADFFHPHRLVRVYAESDATLELNRTFRKRLSAEHAAAATDAAALSRARRAGRGVRDSDGGARESPEEESDQPPPAGAQAGAAPDGDSDGAEEEEADHFLLLRAEAGVAPTSSRPDRRREGRRHQSSVARAERFGICGDARLSEESQL